MAARFFGEFLIANDLITEQILDEVLQIQHESNKMLGEIAVSVGLITKKQVEDINHRQLVENKRFGEIAIDLDLLSSEQLGELLLKQQRQRKFFGGILVELGFLSQDEIDTQLRAHEKEKNQAYQAMLKEIKDHPLANLLTATIDASEHLFVRTLHENTGFAELLHLADLTTPRVLKLSEVCCQILVGKLNPLSIVISTCRATAATIAHEFTLHPIEECDIAFSADAFAEFANIIVGQLIGDIKIADSANRLSNKSGIVIDEICKNASHFLIAEMNSQIGHFIIVISRES